MTTQRARLTAALAILVTILLAGAGALLHRQTKASRERRSGAYSNILPADYVGPEVCRECHQEKYAQWRTHPHSRMNANASEQLVVGDFSGKTIEYDGGSVVFDHVDGRFTMTLTRAGQVHRFVVTRTVGSRFQQMYIGVLVDGPPAFARFIRAATEVKLPFAYSITRKCWLPFTYLEGDGPSPEYTESGERTQYDDMYDPRGFGPWDRTCIWCHNTYPYVKRLENRRLLGFPEEEIALWGDTDQPDPRLHAPPPPPSRVPPRLLPSDLVTVGISCESCHFGGLEHARHKRQIHFLPTSDALRFPGATAERIKAPRESAYVVNSICRQCHTAHSSRYPNSASIDNSAEARDLMEGACASEIRCVDCHNPHQPGPTVAEAPDRREHIEACLRCHEKYREAGAAEAHAGHSRDSGVTCLDCHMPRIVNGLVGIARTHQISSPTDPRMFAAAAPNACNLCHLDRSLTWTLAALDRQWGVKLQPEESWKSEYGGSLDGPTGIAWLRHAHPIVRRVAADAYGRSPLGRAALPQLLPILNDAYATNRTFGLAAIERILGRTLTEEEYSLLAPLAVRRRQAATLAAVIER